MSVQPAPKPAEPSRPLDRRHTPSWFALPRFRPRLIDALHGYTRQQFFTDAAAGLTVGVLALPLAIAFAIASGMPPASGIYTAVVAGFLISLLGGSRVQIGGPTGAFIVIVYGIVVQYGVANLLVCTVLAGLMLLAMGVARVGTWIRFIPVSVITGFTKGIAVLILISQIRDFLGLDVPDLPAEFGAKLSVLWQGLPTLNPQSAALGMACLLLIVFWPKAWRIVPAPVVALVAGTIAATSLGLEVETIGSRFGEMPNRLPYPEWPDMSLSALQHLIAPAFTIALLGAIESLLSARVADAAIDDRHDPNQELMAQGLANIAAPLFGGFCATGAIARTSTNVQMGGRTPVAGMIHALTLMAIVLVGAPVARYIPLATLAAILIVVAWNMAEWHDLKSLPRYTANYRAVLFSTFVLTVVLDLTVAVEVGIVLAAALFITRVSQLTGVHQVELIDAPHVRAFALYGSLFFGAANKLEPLLAIAAPEEPARVIVLDMQKVINVDYTGLDLLEALQRKLARSSKRLIFVGLNPQPMMIFRRSGFADAIGHENLVSDFTAAIERARSWHEPRRSSAEHGT